MLHPVHVDRYTPVPLSLSLCLSTCLPFPFYSSQSKTHKHHVVTYTSRLRTTTPSCGVDGMIGSRHSIVLVLSIRNAGQDRDSDPVLFSQIITSSNPSHLVGVWHSSYRHSRRQSNPFPRQFDYGRRGNNHAGKHGPLRASVWVCSSCHEESALGRGLVCSTVGPCMLWIFTPTPAQPSPAQPYAYEQFSSMHPILHRSFLDATPLLLPHMSHLILHAARDSLDDQQDYVLIDTERNRYKTTKRVASARSPKHKGAGTNGSISAGTYPSSSPAAATAAISSYSSRCQRSLCSYRLSSTSSWSAQPSWALLFGCLSSSLPSRASSIPNDTTTTDNIIIIVGSTNSSTGRTSLCVFVSILLCLDGRLCSTCRTPPLYGLSTSTLAPPHAAYGVCPGHSTQGCVEWTGRRHKRSQWQQGVSETGASTQTRVCGRQKEGQAGCCQAYSGSCPGGRRSVFAKGGGVSVW